MCRPWRSRSIRTRSPCCGPEAAPVPLVWPEREIALLERGRRTEVGCFPHRPVAARAYLPASSSIASSAASLQARGIVEGPNFAFGHDRLGDVTSLARLVRRGGDRFRGGRGDGDRRSAGLVVLDPAVLERRPRRKRPRGSWAVRIVFAGRSIHGAGPRRGPGVSDSQSDARSTRWFRPEGVYAGLAWIDGHGPALAGGVQYRSQPDVRRTSPQGRSPPDRVCRRPLRQERSSSIFSNGCGGPGSSRVGRAARADQADIERDQPDCFACEPCHGHSLASRSWPVFVVLGSRAGCA